MFQDTPSICVPITTNQNFHPSQIEIVALYLYFQDGKTQLVNFSHPDATQSELKLEDIQLHPKSLVLNKKGTIYNGFNEGIDLNSYLQYYTDDTINIQDFYGKAIEQLQSRLYSHKNLGKIISLN